MTILVTGSAGFIGSNFINSWFDSSDEEVISLDALTYAGNLNNLNLQDKNKNHHFENVDISDRKKIKYLFDQYEPRAIIHFAAESHVDRSISGSDAFIKTNIIGTYNLLEVCREYYSKHDITFIHISTDEVFGSLSDSDDAFSELTAYKPNSPYSASKAASDHLVRAWHHTYDLPVITTNCSNNFGPYQFPEKLIPLIILNAMSLKSLPIYGNGKNVRDWLYVSDHCHAITRVLDKGVIGESYNIGGNCELTNLEVVTKICNFLDQIKAKKQGSYLDQIKYVSDRPGHDYRYAINAKKITDNLGWSPKETFESGLRKTVEWYIKNSEWIRDIESGRYQKINK
jgi:dTDP-glucose 4,6-dehydratase